MYNFYFTTRKENNYKEKIRKKKRKEGLMVLYMVSVAKPHPVEHL